MKKKFLKTVIYLSTILVIGCAGVPLQPGAEKVAVITSQPPGYCKHVGPVSNFDINGSTVWYTSDQNLHAMEVNALRNQAVAKGANCVVITHHVYTKTNHPGFTLTNAHKLAGVAYSCPRNTYFSQTFDVYAPDK